VPSRKLNRSLIASAYARLHNWEDYKHECHRALISDMNTGPGFSETSGNIKKTHVAHLSPVFNLTGQIRIYDCLLFGATGDIVYDWVIDMYLTYILLDSNSIFTDDKIRVFITYIL
jgi:hypothetical protein